MHNIDRKNNEINLTKEVFKLILWLYPHDKLDYVTLFYLFVTDTININHQQTHGLVIPSNLPPTETPRPRYTSNTESRSNNNPTKCGKHVHKKVN